jgi:hypothetical protein
MVVSAPPGESFSHGEYTCKYNADAALSAVRNLNMMTWTPIKME